GGLSTAPVGCRVEPRPCWTSGCPGRSVPIPERDILRGRCPRRTSRSSAESTKPFLRNDWDQPAQLLDPDVELHGTIGGLSEGTVARGLLRIRQEFEQEDSEAWEESTGTREDHRRRRPRRRVPTRVPAREGAAESSSRPIRQSSLRCATDA